jgi:hypothetical protein
MRSSARRRAILLLCVLALCGCASEPVRGPAVPDIPEAEPDPLAFLGTAFPTGVAVTASTITSRAAGMSWDVLACVEHENVVGFIPEHDVDFVNLYLVRQSSVGDPTREPPRYLVVDLWRYRPAAGVKICHRWVTWQAEPPLPPSRADYAVLIEDFDNRVIGERIVGIEPDVLDELARFYADAVEFFTDHPPENPDEAAPVASGGPSTNASPQSVTSTSSPQRCGAAAQAGCNRAETERWRYYN